jgi:hypothetical protein
MKPEITQRANAGKIVAASGGGLALLGAIFGTFTVPLGPFAFLLFGSAIYLAGSFMVIRAKGYIRGSSHVFFLRIVRFCFIAAFMIIIYRFSS